MILHLADNNAFNRSRGPGGVAHRSTDDRYRDYIVRSTQIYTLWPRLG